MRLALHCHGEIKLTNGRNGREGRYKEEDGVVPTSPNTPPSSPKICSSCLHTAKDGFPSRIQKK